MRQIRIEPNFADWQEAARDLLNQEVTPEQVLWVEATDSQPALDFLTERPSPTDSAAPKRRVPAKFIELARSAAFHSSSGRWALLYRLLWRLTHEQPRLLEVPTDADVIALTHLSKEVQKDAYRMRAFLRFRETRLNEQPWFVAWYEPEHDTVPLNETFFANRFANMNWSILTPRRCMHHQQGVVTLSEGVSRSAAPQGDSFEPLWITYYSSIFNPARIKPAAMQAQLLKRNWKNLPEAVVIEPLLREARRRVGSMIERSESQRVRESDYGVARPPSGADLAGLRAAALGCKACPLWRTATCTVFGEGPAHASIVLVGEQPGDQEDKAGRAFIGPAGQILDRALARAGIDRQQLYVTNAVKHFKFEPRGKRRIHKTASPREIAACRPWLEAELQAIKPALIVALGATAVRSLFGTSISVTTERGKFLDSPFGRTLITIHPAALLRLPEPANFEPEFARFVADLRLMV